MMTVAGPMVGGLATSFLMKPLVCLALYLLWKSCTAIKGENRPESFRLIL